jgi:hypothetical protein
MTALESGPLGVEVRNHLARHGQRSGIRKQQVSGSWTEELCPSQTFRVIFVVTAQPG